MPEMSETPAKVTPRVILEKKLRRERMACLTAYDFAMAKLVDEAGIEFILVGDTLSEVVLGHENTLPVGVETMLHHTRAVSRAVKHALLVGDLPFGSYQGDEREALQTAIRFVKEAGAEAIKFEGGAKRAGLARRLVDAEIPTVGHLGLTPQSVHSMGGYRVQGRTAEALEKIYDDAIALDAAGVFAIVLEGIPRELAAAITGEVQAATIGIGAGPDCDGQILVLHDVLNLSFRVPAKFVRNYADAAALIKNAVAAFKAS